MSTLALFRSNKEEVEIQFSILARRSWCCKDDFEISELLLMSAWCVVHLCSFSYTEIKHTTGYQVDAHAIYPSERVKHVKPIYDLSFIIAHSHITQTLSAASSSFFSSASVFLPCRTLFFRSHFSLYTTRVRILTSMNTRTQVLLYHFHQLGVLIPKFSFPSSSVCFCPSLKKIIRLL